MELKNPKWEKFCVEYFRSGNIADAYKKAGYKTENLDSLYSNAHRILKKDGVQARLKELRDEMASEKIANAVEMQEILTKIARQEQQEEVVIVEGVDKGITEAKVILKRPSNADAIKAISQLARMQGVDNGSAAVNIIIPLFGGEENLED